MIARSTGSHARLSCADSAFPRLSHRGALQVIADLGILAVDVCVFAGMDHTPPEAVVADPEGTADRVRQRVDEIGLEVVDVFVILATSFRDLAVNHPDPGVRVTSLGQFREAVRFAAHLGSPGMTILPGATYDGVDPAESRALAASELQRRSEIAGEVGLELSIEAHYQSIVPTIATTEELLAAAPGLSLTLDYSHFVYQGIPEREVDVLIPHARHVQLRQAAPGVMQARVTEGAIDFVRVQRDLEAAGYAGYLGLEYQHEEWLDCLRVDCISETAALRDLLLETAAP